MRRRRYLIDALAQHGFRRLLAARLAGQFGDGVFQASLAGTVLFNPERQAHPAEIAAGFAVLLLPYSLVGPFAGVLLDRWWRQRVLTAANLARAVGVLGVAGLIAAGTLGVPFYAAALVIISISRFILSALGASLPRVITADELVTANALSTTAGTVCSALGGAVAIGVRALAGGNDAVYAVVAATSLGPYLLAAAVASGFARPSLGPSEQERRGRETPAQVLRGLAAGARDVRETPPVAAALLMITGHRLCFGIWTVCTLLLYRNWFVDDGIVRAGLAGLGQVLAAVAVGGAAAALVTPTVFRQLGPIRWIATLLLASAVVEVGLGLAYRPALVVLTGLLLGFAAQAIKISVDTVVQQQITDRFRGRVFALYDMLFNLSLVLAATLTAVALPPHGHSPSAVLAIGAGWMALAAGYVSSARRATA